MCAWAIYFPDRPILLSFAAHFPFLPSAQLEKWRRHAGPFRQFLIPRSAREQNQCSPGDPTRQHRLPPESLSARH
jgi:hypothetical protein